MHTRRELLIAGRALALGAAASTLADLPSLVRAQSADMAEIVRGDPSTGVVALTFDAGGVAGPADRVLGALRERGLRVTLFLAGSWVTAYPSLALQAAEDGHELANHSYSHPDFTRLSDGQIVQELERAEAAAQQVTGQQTRPYFRAPFGARNARVLRAAAADGFRSVLWTLDSGDWRAGVSGAQVLTRVLRLAQPGDVVVQHVASEATAQVLPALLDELAARGWSVGSVSDVLGVPRAAPADGPAADPPPGGPPPEGPPPEGPLAASP